MENYDFESLKKSLMDLPLNKDKVREFHYELITETSKVKFQLTQILKLYENGNIFINYKIFGASALFKRDANQFEISGSDLTLAICKNIKAETGKLLAPGKGVTLKLSASDVENLRAIETEFKRPYKEEQDRIKQEKDVEIAKMPTFLCFNSGFNWGDYSIEAINQVVKVRAMTEEEKGRYSETHRDKYIIQEYIMNDSPTLSEIGIEGREKFGESTDSYDLFLISDEEVQQLRTLWNEKQEEKRLIEAEKQAKIKAKEQEAEKIRADKFAEAKATGKPVLLNSWFVSGDDVPRKYQHIEDNDMGSICIYAMPDGSTREDFSPSY